MTDDLHVHVETRAEWRAWLAEHHDRVRRMRVVRWRSDTGRPAPSYEELVLEALAFGWIDSTVRRVGEDRISLLMTPRRPGSGWAATNKRRVVELREAGLMTTAGEDAIARAMADGSWTLLDDAEQQLVPPDLAGALESLPGAREAWDAFPKSARRAMLVWMGDAKRPETRAKRVQAIADGAARGERTGPAAQPTVRPTKESP